MQARSEGSSQAVFRSPEDHRSSVDAALRLDAPNRLRFAHAPLNALLFTIVSFGFTWLCWTFIDDEPVIRYGFTAFSLLFVIAGVFGIFWRNEIDIDLVGRRVRLRRGLWPSPKTCERSLDEADGVFLTLEYRSSGSKRNKRKVPWWFVSLRFPEDKKGTRIFTSRKEVEAYGKWEHYAERLALDAVDATDSEPKRSSWRDLDEKLATRAREADDTPLRAPARPSGSNVRIVSNRGRREYVLPMPGFSWGLVFLAVFGGAFVALGARGDTHLGDRVDRRRRRRSFAQAHRRPHPRRWAQARVSQVSGSGRRSSCPLRR